MTDIDRWERVERLVIRHLKAEVDARWRKRMSYAARVEAVQDALRAGRNLGFVLRWGARKVRPRRPTTVMGQCVRLPHGGLAVNLAVRSNEAAFHHFRILVVFP